MRTNRFPVLVACVALSSGCAATVPFELVNARHAYQRASNGSAARLAPAELHVASVALAQAEQSFQKDPASYQTLDLAYVAERKAELAEATASISSDKERQSQAKDDFQATQGKIVTKTKQDLRQTRTALAASEHTGELTAAQLETEKQARMSAEDKLAGAMKDLATIAAIKEDARGVVITLSGSVLFASGKYALLNTAMTKLDQVAVALNAQDSDRRMIVEGHTDNQGSDSVNQPLSLNRATAVRDYLVTRGVATEKITAIGRGSNKPITDNKTAEDRANNRRVEIIIERESHTSNP